MAADDLKISIRALRYERQRLSDVVLTPLQRIKDFVARNLKSDEVSSVVALLHNVIRGDTLRTISDGEALIAVLDLYYGKDNIGVLKRLLHKITCGDLVKVLDDWEGSSNPVDTQVFRECGYFPLWIRIKGHFSWFSENKKTIFKSIKTLFGIPEIDPSDPDYDTLVFMGVSLGKTDVLVYVLVPMCMRKHVRGSVEERDVALSLKHLHITGVYFGRRSGRERQSDNHSTTSFSSISESMQGSDVEQLRGGQNVQHELSNGMFNFQDNIPGKDHNSNFRDLEDSLKPRKIVGQKHSLADESVRVVRTSVGYIDQAPPVYKNRSDQPGTETVRVVHPKIKYINPGNQVQPDDALYSQNSRRVVYPRVFDLDKDREVTESAATVQSQRSDEDEHYIDPRGVRPAVDELEGLIVPDVRRGRVSNDWQFPDDNAHIISQELSNRIDELDLEFSEKSEVHVQASNSTPDDFFEENYEGNGTSKRKTSVLDFSDNDIGYVDKSRVQQGLVQDQLTTRTRDDNNLNIPPEKPKSIQSEKGSSKYLGNGLYASSVTFQVNMNRKSSASLERPDGPGYPAEPITYMNREDHVSLNEAPLNMSLPEFVESEVTLQDERPLQSHVENGFPRWYEDTSADDYYKEMKPEPEPGYVYSQQNYEGFRHVMVPEEEKATVNQDVQDRGRTPLFSPPNAFRDATPGGSQLVKVKTRQLDDQRRQPSLVSVSGNALKRWDWENSSVESDQPGHSSRETTVPKNRVTPLVKGAVRAQEHSPTIYTQHNKGRVGVVEGHPRQSLIFMKSDSEFHSDYEDSVFTESESPDVGYDRFSVVPPPYVPPPDYKASFKGTLVKSSDDSTSTDTSDFVYKSPLLSAASITSIYKEKEMFLSREELQLSIRGAEDKEVEKQIELCRDLMTAAKAGNEEEVKRTIDEGVDVNHQNEFGHSAVMVASREGHLDVVETLIGADADVDLQEGFGKSALHEAALSGQHKVVHRLISAGASTNITDEEHRTPLHYAAMRGKRRIAEVLLLFDANVSVLTKSGESAVELAYCYRHDDIVDLLMSSRDKKTRKEMEGQIRKQKLRQLSSAASLPNLSKASSMKELSRSRSRPDLRKKKSVCVIQ